MTKISDAFETSVYHKELIDEIDSTHKKESSSEDLKNTFDSRGYEANSWNQIRWLVWRNFVSQMRNPQETRVHILQTIVVALIFGLTYMKSKLDQDGVQSLNGALFFIVANQSFSNCNTVITNFPAEMPVFYREYSSKMYRVFNYYLSKMISEVSYLLDLFENYLNSLEIIYFSSCLDSYLCQYFSVWSDIG